MASRQLTYLLAHPYGEEVVQCLESFLHKLSQLIDGSLRAGLALLLRLQAQSPAHREEVNLPTLHLQQ